MDTIKEYEEKLSGYSNTITNAKKACEKAEKDLLVEETRLSQYEEQKQKIEKECKDLVGVEIDKLDDLLQVTMTSLDQVTAFVSANLSGTPQINESAVDNLTNFMQTSGIDLTESAF